MLKDVVKKLFKKRNNDEFSSEINDFEIKPLEKVVDLYVAKVTYILHVYRVHDEFQSCLTAPEEALAIVKLNNRATHGVDILNGKALPLLDECSKEEYSYEEFLKNGIYAISSITPLQNIVNQYALNNVVKLDAVNDATITREEARKLLGSIIKKYDENCKKKKKLNEKNKE